MNEVKAWKENPSNMLGATMGGSLLASAAYAFKHGFENPRRTKAYNRVVAYAYKKLKALHK